MEKKVDVVVVGAGPAGLSAGIEIAKGGGSVVVVDENSSPGGQLFKQIHRFFGSKQHYAGIRGFDIGNKLLDECKIAGVEIMLNSVVWGIFPGYTVGVVHNNRQNISIKTQKVILATGASENALSFPGWTLPGVMGAGAAQTMMNVHRVLPGKRALMVGSGNVGLIVSWQLMQAGCEVVAVVDVLPEVGGYMVHANKISRLGVKILTEHTIVKAEGQDRVEQAIVCRVDKNFKPIPGTQKKFNVDLVCLAVGLTPLSELAWIAGCSFGYFPKLGGFVPLHNPDMETTLQGIYVAGDISGIEEASTAMEEGRLAATSVLESLGLISKTQAIKKKEEINQSLRMLRIGKYGDFRKDEKEKIFSEYEKIKKGTCRSNKLS